MRIVQVPEETSLDRLGRSLLSGRPRRDQMDAALDRLRAANPQADPNRLAAGSLLFVPEGAGFEASVGTPVPAAVPLGELQAMTAAAFKSAERDLEARFGARTAERREVAATLEGDAFRRVSASDELLQRQAEEAMAAMGKEEEADKAASEALFRAGRAAAETLARLAKNGR